MRLNPGGEQPRLLERLITGPKRLGLFGHRAVGKTTLLAMMYREASAGRIDEVRLAAADNSSASYLADKITQLESGQAVPATLGEAELQLRLYHGPDRYDLIVKDYQGEHVDLESEEHSIRDFFADCDIVFLCLDPEGTGSSSERLKRQQEIEALLERFIEASEEGKTDRPVAVLVTKYDEILERNDPEAQDAGDIFDHLYGMTRHTLVRHAGRSDVFGVSAFGAGASGGRPPAQLNPIGLGEPLRWMAESLEQLDRQRLERLLELAPRDYKRFSRCLKALERRYPQVAWLETHRKRHQARKKRQSLRSLAAVALLIVAGVASVAAYDFVAFRAAESFEKQGYSATTIEKRWTDYLRYHPTATYFYPEAARQARSRQRYWQVEATRLRLELGTANPGPELDATLARIKEEEPALADAVRKVEKATELARHDDRWRELGAMAGTDVVVQASAIEAFLGDYPESPHRAEAQQRLDGLKTRLAASRDESERLAVEAMKRDLNLPDPDLGTILEEARAFLDAHPQSSYRDDATRLLEQASRRIDEIDIQKARDFSQNFPTSFPTRRRKYEDYLAEHPTGGQFVREALEAIAEIDRQREVYEYRAAFNHARGFPNDVPAIARLLQTYLDQYPGGRFARAAKAYIDWWEQIRKPQPYRVRLKRGLVEKSVGKYLSGGGPDLSVTVWVNGAQHGPSPVARNSHDPIWEYTFPKPIIWKYGDPIVIRITDHDWSSEGSGVFRLHSAKGDMLAMRLLSGEVRPGDRTGRTRLYFDSEFKAPSLPAPN